jgi:hypothetical protein
VGVLLPDYSPADEEEGVTPTAEPTAEAEPTEETEGTEEAETPAGLPPSYTSQTLASFAPRNAYDFVWTPGLAWSPDGEIILSTLHGAPIGSEAAEDSPVFDLVALLVSGSFQAELVPQAGIWSLAHYAPASEDATESGPIAYLEALNPLDSVISRYRLVLMDRDGSNRRVVFPANDQPGLLPRDLDYRGFVWSPDGLQIALIYQGNLYLIDVSTGLPQQITQDGQARSPRWTP